MVVATGSVENLLQFGEPGGKGGVAVALTLDGAGGGWW